MACDNCRQDCRRTAPASIHSSLPRQTPPRGRLTARCVDDGTLA
jgi:hypothetical protein